MEWQSHSPGYLKPLVGKSPNNIHSTQAFVKQANKVSLQPGECLSSHDITALFTSVPADPALDIIKGLLEQDCILMETTVLPVKDVILLLGFCLHNTYFSFQGQFIQASGESGHGVPSQPHNG